jgi:hypothetical protein
MATKKKLSIVVSDEFKDSYCEIHGKIVLTRIKGQTHVGTLLWLSPA